MSTNPLCSASLERSVISGHNKFQPSLTCYLICQNSITTFPRSGGFRANPKSSGKTFLFLSISQPPSFNRGDLQHFHNIAHRRKVRRKRVNKSWSFTQPNTASTFSSLGVVVVVVAAANFDSDRVDEISVSPWEALHLIKLGLLSQPVVFVVAGAKIYISSLARQVNQGGLEAVSVGQKVSLCSDV